MLELLISKGADIHAKDIIYLNILQSFLIIMNEIKERNLPLNNETPLHIALEKNSKEMFELLITKGVDINAKDIIYLNRRILFLIKII